MTDELYKVLGVEKGASPKAVHAAYRRAAKHAHPDAPGGSQKRFELVKTARDVLSDPELEAIYARTGEIGEKPPDIARTDALQCIAAALEFALADCMQRNLEPEAVDLLERMRGWIKAQLNDNKRGLALIEKDIAKADRLSARFGSRKADPVMPQLIAGRKSLLRARAEHFERNQRSIIDALAILDDETYAYEVSRPQPTMSMRAILSNL